MRAWAWFRDSLAVPVGRWIASRPRLHIEMACLVATLIIGLVDYSLGAEISLSVVYVLPVAIVAWFVGGTNAVVLSIISVAVWITGDLAAGLRVSSIWVPVINCSFRLLFYGVFIFMLTRLNHLQRNLESRAEGRAVALAHEIAERERLEHEMLQISEREQRRIGQDLHDGLCQHLTGTALAGHVLAERLQALGLDEAGSANKIVDLVEEAISLARGMAKGLHPVELQADGLMQALEEFTVTTSELFNVHCWFECHYPVLIHDSGTATHLYRIAQEAVSNAIKHGRASDIAVLLEESEQGLRLVITDNGPGVPAILPVHDGMGLRIMADRAKMIGGRFTVGRGRDQGAELTCLIPAA